MLLRGNGSPMFLLANVVDDIEMGITHVVRGEEHLSNTPKQQLLWSALGQRAAGVGPRPGPRQRGAQEAVEASRQGGPRVVPRRGLPRRGDGQLSDDARLGAAIRRQSDRSESEIVPWSVIEESFRLEDVTHSPAFFDVKKLAAFNGEYIRMLTRRRVRRRLRAVPARRLRPRGLRGDGAARADPRRDAGRGCPRWSTS